MNWYGHVQRMDEGRVPQKFWNGVRLAEEKEKEEEMEELEIRGWRKLQQE